MVDPHTVPLLLRSQADTSARSYSRPQDSYLNAEKRRADRYLALAIIGAISSLVFAYAVSGFYGMPGFVFFGSSGSLLPLLTIAMWRAHQRSTRNLRVRETYLETGRDLATVEALTKLGVAKGFLLRELLQWLRSCVRPTSEAKPGHWDI